jgi:hypothetical protein
MPDHWFDRWLVSIDTKTHGEVKYAVDRLACDLQRACAALHIVQQHFPLSWLPQKRELVQGALESLRTIAKELEDK